MEKKTVKHKREEQVTPEVQYRMDDLGMKSWRNNVGGCWQSSTQPIVNKDAMGRVESVVLIRPQWVRYGLKVGSADRIGHKTMVIGPEHVGKKIAVFVSAEMKASDGQADPEQVDWMHNRIADGCIAFIARGPEDVPDMWVFPNGELV